MMRRRFRRPDHSVPELNMASLPDLIFTVLFFFMIVTHMRDVEKRVAYEVPAGTEVEKEAHKSAVVHIYIGRPLDGSSDTYCIQLNNQLTTVGDIRNFIETERRPHVARGPGTADGQHRGRPRRTDVDDQ